MSYKSREYERIDDKGHQIHQEITARRCPLSRSF